MNQDKKLKMFNVFAILVCAYTAIAVVDVVYRLW